MEAMRELLRGSLRSSLSGMREEDRLAAAWTVACGHAMAEHGVVVGFEAGVCGSSRRRGVDAADESAGRRAGARVGAHQWPAGLRDTL